MENPPLKRGRQAALSFLLLSLAVALIYGVTVNGERVGDDAALIPGRLDPARVSFESLWLDNYWGEYDDSGLYRPLALSLLYAQRLAFGLNNVPYRLVSLSLYALCSMLFFIYVSRIAGEVAAWFAAALFVVHPVHVEAVVTGYGQAEILAAAFVFASLIAYVNAERTGRRSWLGMSILAVAAGCLVKESVLVTPALALLTRGVWLAAGVRGWRRWISWRALSLAAGCLPMLLLKQVLLESVLIPNAATALSGFSGIAWLKMVLVAGLGGMVRLILFPFSQSIQYDIFDQLRRDAMWVIAGAAALRVAARILGAGPVAFAAGWFFSFWLLFGNLVFPTGVLVAERLLFLPVAGPCVLGGLLFERALRMRPAAFRRLAVALAGLAIVAGAVRSATTGWQWRTPASSLRASLNSIPTSPTLKGALAIQLLLDVEAEGGSTADPRVEESSRLAGELLASYPDMVEGHRALGRLALLRRDFAAAEGHFHRAVELRPRDSLARMELDRARGLLTGLP